MTMQLYRVYFRQVGGTLRFIGTVFAVSKSAAARDERWNRVRRGRLVVK